jgi:MFS transporter, DHA2 family, multidrug resistance protein
VRDMESAPAAAGESIGAAHAVAEKVGGPAGEALAGQAGLVFTEALGVGLTAAAVVALAGALLVLLRLPSGGVAAAKGRPAVPHVPAGEAVPA